MIVLSRQTNSIRGTYAGSFSGMALLAGTIILIVVSILTFNVFHFSAYYGLVQVNYLNSLLLVPFIALIIAFGIFLGRSGQSEKASSIDRYELTSREKEILRLILEGKKNTEIADQLFVELSTIKSHVNNIYKKTNATGRNQLKKLFQD